MQTVDRRPVRIGIWSAALNFGIQQRGRHKPVQLYDALSKLFLDRSGKPGMSGGFACRTRRLSEGKPAPAASSAAFAG